jgi:hypothetical protein
MSQFVKHVKRQRVINFLILDPHHLLELIYSDVWGPAPYSSGRKNYYVSFINDFSKYTRIYLIRHCSEVFNIFHQFQALVERRFGQKIITFQSDREVNMST